MTQLLVIFIVWKFQNELSNALWDLLLLRRGRGRERQIKYWIFPKIARTSKVSLKYTLSFSAYVNFLWLGELLLKLLNVIQCISTKVEKIMSATKGCWENRLICVTHPLSHDKPLMGDSYYSKRLWDLVIGEYRFQGRSNLSLNSHLPAL